MKIVVRCALHLVLCVLSFAFCLTTAFAATDEDRGKQAVERQQQIELRKFYYANSGMAPLTPMAIQMYNDAVRFFEKGEYELAREAVKESIDLEPRNALAWELWGEIENLQQDFEKADEYYKKSYRLNPSPRMRQKIEKLQKERTVEEKLDSYDEEHFIIKYRQGDEGYEGYGLKNLLRETYRQISQDFGYYFNHKTVVLFYQTGEFHSVTGQKHWVGGMYDGKIRLPAYHKGYSERDLRAVVAHEMTHPFVASLSGMRAPAWLHEGLAQYEENKVRPVDTIVFDSAVKTGALIPLNELFSNVKPMQQKDPLLVALFYQQAFKLTEYMVERYRMVRMKEILEKFREGKATEEILEEVLGISIQQLEKDWRSTIPGL